MRRLADEKNNHSPHKLYLVISCYVLMVVFNTYLTALPIIRYDFAKTMGFTIITWPIEDIAYLVVALYMTPVLYTWFNKYYEQSTSRKKSPAPKKKADESN
ncbi:hypothetical protein KBC99_01030 [Candidatus Saccharibacteria bacterium]|nr:hypothetical protein [Candidatus Saccharibacteria bacterium]